MDPELGKSAKNGLGQVGALCWGPGNPGFCPPAYDRRYLSSATHAESARTIRACGPLGRYIASNYKDLEKKLEIRRDF